MSNFQSFSSKLHIFPKTSCTFVLILINCYTKDIISTIILKSNSLNPTNVGGLQIPISILCVSVYRILAFQITKCFTFSFQFVLGDHGKPYHRNPGHLGGYYETLLPFLSVVMPTWVLHKAPSIMDNLITNQQRYLVRI